MGVYVHIPFCAQKCYYCDFHSVVVGDQEQFLEVTDNYLTSLRKEALYYAKSWGTKPLNTIFIGGGTPTVLPPKDLANFIMFLRENLPFTSQPEITVEANPHSVNKSYAQILAEAGVNRISLGVQAFQNELLRAIGRVHVAEQVELAVSALRKAGITNINLDLIFGLPDQSLAQWIETLEKAIALKPSHLSCYGLILEPDTPLAKWEATGLINVPNDDEQALMFAKTNEVLTKVGYGHYEISNYCLPDMESKHNLLYWKNKEFIALGSGATGYINRLRYTNKANLERYVQTWKQGVPLYAEEDEVSLEQEMDETMMVGMRLLKGIAEQDFIRRYHMSFFDVYERAITNLMERGLVHFIAGHLRVTEQGLYLENQVSLAFLR